MDYLVNFRSVQTPLNDQFSIGANTLNRAFTFSSPTRKGIGKKWSLFLLVNGFCGIVNYGAYAALVSTFVFFAQFPVLAVAIGSVTGLVFNFSLSSRFVFTKVSEFLFTGIASSHR